ncbi:MAG: UDP binding domain-containing protein [Nitrospirota bacterium]
MRERRRGAFEFIEQVLAQKTVSVWGIGYLGFTTILKLQSKGFRANNYNFDKITRRDIKDGIYPSEMLESRWSVRSDVPPLDIEKTNILTEPDEMFSSNVQIISLPLEANSEDRAFQSILKEFIKNKKRLADSLVIFQSACIPGEIESHFIEELSKESVDCAFASAFRSDWTVEEFFSDTSPRILAGYDDRSTEWAEAFFTLFDIPYEVLPSIKEAEIFENTKNSLRYALSAFLNQVALAYPGTNIRKMVELLRHNIELEASPINVGSSNFRMFNAIGNMLKGAERPEYLSLLKEAQTVNLSNLLYYADILTRSEITSVTILGLSAQGDLKDIRFSPSLILAQYLHQSNIKVFINDPHFSEEELKQILPYADTISIARDPITTDVVIVMVDHKEYRYLTQKDLDGLNIPKSKIVIDNVGLFKKYSFPEGTLYHTPGDGSLKALES